jgi:hypothetical protein
VYVADGSVFTVGDFVKVAETSEVMKITAISTNALTVTRGAAGTTATAISAAATALTKQTLTAADATGSSITGYTDGAGYDNAVTTVNVGTGAVFAVGEFVKVAETSEIMKITAMSGTEVAGTWSGALTVTRGAAGTTATAISAAPTTLTKQTITAADA